MKPLPAFAFLALIVVPTLRADTVFVEDFTAVQNPASLGQWQGNKNQVDESFGAWLEVAADEGNVFGEGTGNRFLAVRDRSDTAQVNLYAKLNGTGDVVTASFDFAEPSDSEAGPVVFRVGTGRNELSELAVNLLIRDGRIEPGPQDAYTIGDKHRVTIVVNNSPDTVNYGTTSVPSQHYDVYVDGQAVLTARPFDTQEGSLSPGAALDALRLLTYSGVTKDQALLIDNVEVKTGAHAP